MSADEFTDMVLEIPDLLARVQRGTGEPVTRMAGHDLAKRLYRMGYRLSAPPELDRCRTCGREAVTAQAMCMDCRDPAGR